MAQVFPSRAQALYEEGKVSVISHRGDWRNTPENSIRAIQNCIDLGVNMVEIDIKKTKDNELILLLTVSEILFRQVLHVRNHLVRL